MSGIELLLEMASTPRLELLNLLQNESLKVSQIAKIKKSSIQAVSRHLERLEKSGLIEKDSHGKYQTTSIAKVLLLQVPFFEFLGKNKEYFKTHDFTGIPDHLVSRIGELEHCKLETDFMKSIQMGRDFFANSREFIYGISNTSPEKLFDIILEKDKDFHYKVVFGANGIFPKGFSEYPARKKCLKILEKNHFQEKIVKSVPVVAVISEKGCQLLFSNKEIGQADGSGGIFFGSDKKSIQWCRELVDHYWNMPELKGFKLKEN